MKRLSALSRIGGREEPPNITPVSLHEVLAACVLTFTCRAEEASIKIAHPAQEDPLIALADAVLLRLVFNNLLDNAISYATSDSTISIEINRSRSRIETTFTNACKNLPENLERLFEPLFRRDNSRTETENSHLGIGLTLSREAAAAMGGSLTASRVGHNSIRFVLSLPAK